MDHWAETRFVETDMGWDGYVWVCERCDDDDLPEDTNFNFCPKCGRRIMEFVKLEDKL